MTFLEGHFVTPTIVGRRLALNALAVFIALAFWTWLWGPMGAFLASPLLIVALILKDHLMPVNSPQLPGGLASNWNFRCGGTFCCDSFSSGAFDVEHGWRSWTEKT